MIPWRIAALIHIIAPVRPMSHRQTICNKLHYHKLLIFTFLYLGLRRLTKITLLATLRFKIFDTTSKLSLDIFVSKFLTAGFVCDFILQNNITYFLSSSIIGHFYIKFVFLFVDICENLLNFCYRNI